VKSVIDQIRAHLLSTLGPIDPLPSPVTLEYLTGNAQAVERFDSLRRNRLCVGYLRYHQPLRSGERGRYNSIQRAINCLYDYLKGGNQEHLLDAANLCAVEFVLPACHPEPNLSPVDDGEHTPEVCAKEIKTT
jgi:hypothetical protein